MNDKSKKMLLIIFNSISIIVFIAVTILTVYLTNSYIGVEKTEGTGLFVALVWVVGSLECLFLLLFNSISLALLKGIKNEVEYGYSMIRAQRITSIMLMVLPIAIFVVEVFLLGR